MACHPDEPPKHVFYLANNIQKNTSTPTNNEVSVAFAHHHDDEHLPIIMNLR
jgi:hypothetical protein